MYMTNTIVPSSDITSRRAQIYSNNEAWVSGTASGSNKKEKKRKIIALTRKKVTETQEDSKMNMRLQ